MKTHVEFRSDAFPAYEGEVKEINPGRFGKRLAEFLAAGLAREGFEAGDPIAEDWGWVLPIKNETFPLWIGCGNYEEYSNGFLCFIEPHKPFVRSLFKKISTGSRVGALQEAMHNVLSANARISDIKWWSHDEFNNQWKT